MRAAKLSIVFLAASLLAASPAPAEPTKGGRAFPTKEEAMKALLDALSANDDAALEALAGPGSADVVQSGTDPLVKAERLRVAALAKGGIEYETLDDGTVVPSLGATKWPLPIPLRQGAEGWQFDAATAREEILARRIGTNEMRVMDILRDVVEAQAAYRTKDRDGDGVLEYAQRFVSSDGQHDGLWWKSSADEKEEDRSPLGAALGALDKAVATAQRGKPFSGYRWKMLTAQGASAPGGAKDFLEGENLTGGFGAIAVPAERGNTGVMSFIISHHGRLLEKDLGADGVAVLEAMTTFEPDKTWGIVKPAASAPGATPGGTTPGATPGGATPGDCTPPRR